MIRVPTPSVRVRVTALTTLVFGAALAAGSYALVNSVRSSVETRIEKIEREEITNIAQQVASGTFPADVTLEYAPVANYVIIGPDGSAFSPIAEMQSVGDIPPPTSTRDPVPTPFKISAQALEQGWTTGESMEVQYHDGRVETIVTLPTDSGRAATIRATRPLTEISATVNSVQRLTILGVPFASLLVGLLTWFMAGRALAPVEHIRREAELITQSTLHRRVPVPGSHDEISRLANTMNSMLSRLESTTARERQFLSDASHELRSPVASIGATLEVALRMPESADWPDVARRSLQEQARLSSSIDALVTLASLAEQADHQLVNEEIDLDDIVLDLGHRPRRVPVSVAAVHPVPMRGRADLIERLVRNLVDNAERHANQQVVLSLRAEHGIATMIVDDDGLGIESSRRESVFERFTRLDEGRSRDAGGTGLGLAMVRSIAQRHGGDVRCDESPLGGARFVVTLCQNYQGIATPPLGRKI